MKDIKEILTPIDNVPEEIKSKFLQEWTSAVKEWKGKLEFVG